MMARAAPVLVSVLIRESRTRPIDITPVPITGNTL